MRPERMAAIVSRWVRWYTRRLDGAVAERRREEIAADLRDHIDYARANGDRDSQIVRAIAARMLRGIVADLAWRRRQPKQEEPMSRFRRSAIRVAVGVALILSLPLVAMHFTSEVAWGVGDFVLAGVLLTIIGAALELAAKRAGSIALAVAVGALGVAAAVFGRFDDAPGLILFGILLVGSACALAVRRARPSR